MAPRKRTQSAKKLLGAENSETRAALMQAVEELMLDEGYAAVTARKVAARLGMKHQVVFYYFDTIDDLLLAVFRRTAEEGYARLVEALGSDQPLRALWNHISDMRNTRWTQEFMALANHSPAIREEIATYAAKSRELHAEVLARVLRARGIEPRMSPELLALMMGGMARVLVHDTALGIDLGHKDAEALIDACLRRFEDAPEASRAGESVLDLI